MKFFSAILTIVLLSIGRQLDASQGFQNFDFENATITTDPSSPYYPYGVYTSSAIPGWTAYISGVPQTDIIYNTRPLDAAEVTLQGTQQTNASSFTPIDGNFTVELFGASIYAPQQSAAIGQTGQIPTNTMSLIFLGYSTDVSFDGQSLSLILLDSTPNYNVYGADISAFAGRTGELLFTAQPQSLDIIDDIQFSPSAVPEPSKFAFGALGALILGFRRWRNSLQE